MNLFICYSLEYVVLDVLLFKEGWLRWYFFVFSNFRFFVNFIVIVFNDIIILLYGYGLCVYMF